MTEQEIAAYKDQMFGDGKSSTQPPTQTQAIVPPAEEEKKIEVPTPAAPEAVKVPETQIVDEDVLIKDRLGLASWDEAKAALTELTQLREAAKTPQEIKFANEQSKLLHEAILSGKTDEVFEILDTQKKLSSVGNMKASEAIKLHIQQNNKHYKQVDVEDVFEEKYSYPDKPVKDELEPDEDYKERQHKWEAVKEKIDRRIERDAATAKTELLKLSAELKLPEIQKPEGKPDTSKIDEEKEIQRLAEESKEAYSKVSEKDISMVFKFNDEASKLAFDIAYEPDKESFEKAKSLASDVTEFFKSYYDKDGSPNRVQFLKDLYAGKNIEKIVSEAVVQAVNQTRIDFLRKQKNIGDGSQRNFVIPPTTDLERLKQQVFGN